MSISCSITNDLHFVIESHDADLTLLSTIRHIVNLGVNGTLNTLHARDVGSVPFSLIDKLIGAVAELSHLLDQLLQVVALELVLALDGLSDAHGA